MARIGTGTGDGSGELTTSAEAWQGTNLSQHAVILTLPSGGPWLIQTVGVWCAGYSVNTPARNVVWNASGTVIAYSTADHTLIARTFTASGSDQYYTNVYANGPGLAPCVVNGGSQVYVGFQRQETGSYGAFFGKGSSGTHYEKTADSYLDDFVGNSSHANNLSAFIDYTQYNTAPAAPSWSAPAAGSIIGDTTPTFVWIHSDPDGDACAAWGLEIDTTTGNGVEPDWLTLSGNGREQILNGTTGISGNTITYTGTAKDRGQWYAARCWTADVINGAGPKSVTRFFKINTLPTITNRNPG